MRTYSQLIQFETFLERYRYLALRGVVGDSTFGHDRWLNQAFYKSREWMQVRQFVIARDLGCDLGVGGFEIHERVIVHHMNPMEVSEITHGDSRIINPEFLICTTHNTHNAIHYGDEGLLPRPFVERQPGDTKLW